MSADEKNNEPDAPDETVEESAADVAEESAPEGDDAPEAEAKPKKKSGGRRKKAAEPKAEEAPDAEAEAEADADAGDDDAAGDDAAEGEKKPAKKSSRRRGAAETTTRARTRRPRPDAEPVSVRAQARYVRTAPRKARLVVDHIRGKSVEEARAILAHTPRAAAEPILKVLESAVANAEHNHELLPEELRVEQVFVDEGPTLKRFQPRAQGRATRIRKRTSHITIRITNRTVKN